MLATSKQQNHITLWKRLTQFEDKKNCWWIIFHNEDGYHHTTIFTRKKDLNNAVNNFIEQGYTEQND